MDRIYLDTSFFIGLLENQDNRQEKARSILAYERGNDRFTSQLTLNEFMVRVYDDHKNDPNCDEFVEAVELKIRSIARVVAISDEISRRAALLQSRFGEIHKHATPPKEPRYRGFRWDAIHIATAWERKCERIYAWDGKWEKLPSELKEGLGEILAPARLPGLLSVLDELTETSTAPTTSEVDSSTEPPPPSVQSPAASPALISPPEPSLPLAPRVGLGPPPPPEEDLPATPPPALGPQSSSIRQRSEKLEN